MQYLTLSKQELTREIGSTHVMIGLLEWQLPLLEKLATGMQLNNPFRLYWACQRDQLIRMDSVHWLKIYRKTAIPGSALNSAEVFIPAELQG